jgi:streptogrisin C
MHRFAAFPSFVVAVVALTLSPSCTPDSSPPPPDLPPELLAALQRDLSQTPAEIEARLLAEASASQTLPGLHQQLGIAYAGAWMSDDGTELIVAITDPALADLVIAAGATPGLVSRSLERLEEDKAVLDAIAPDAPDSVHAWYVDVRDNAIVVVADAPHSAAVDAFVADLDDVHVVASDERPHPLYDVRGGDEFILGGNILCSVGFSVDRGFVTAGHCGQVGTATAGSNWVAQGTVRGSTFPVHDYAWVELNSSWTGLPWVGNHAGGAVAVAGSQVAPVGASVCRSGRTTGWRCGVIQAQNVTINYAAGPVYGATQTNACAEGGDSGGSFISGNQAQGVTSGGSGNCSTGGTTFFQPINPILSAYGLVLKTTGGSSEKAIISNYNGKCIDVPGANFVDGAKLQMWDCNGTVAQKWTFVDGTVRAGGKCMDVAWANPNNGTAIQIANCSGNLAQQFVLSGAGDLVSVLANKCVDIANWNPSSGAPLIIWQCTGGSNQKWHTQ